ncbi:SDR family NAD(P)-dependent oxidoreductase [Pseudonocardia lutea]|uniref:SDR family NAD(P)-dependent oxidoreductase n=1 Tax=Pseudonocardia lutea TaxID=2172015 RepID=A0ABW1HZT5_9PSEU
MSPRFAGEVALVTGAASGIGRATAERLAAEGATVVLADLDSAVLDDAVDEVVAKGGTAHGLRLDVTVEQEWADAVGWIAAQLDRLDILVNNAGVGDLRTIEDTTLEGYVAVTNVLQTGVFLGMKAAGPLLKAARGAVVNVSSMFGLVGGAGLSPAYHGAKGAVRTMTKGVAVNWGPDGVRVNSVHPGFIATPMLEGADKAALGAGLPLRRVGSAEEVAAAIAFLASSEAAYITGVELSVDGGYVAQ